MAEWLQGSAAAAGVVYTFYAFAVVCDDYLVPSIDFLCHRWNIPANVAAASILAFGSSAPEIVMAGSATLHNKVEMSLGTLIGSALIAYGLIISSCVLTARCQIDKSNRSDENNNDKKSFIELEAYSVIRDTIWFAACLTLLLWVVQDSVVCWWESILLIIMYIIYLLIVVLPSLCKRGKNTDEEKPLLDANYTDSSSEDTDIESVHTENYRVNAEVQEKSTDRRVPFSITPAVEKLSTASNISKQISPISLPDDATLSPRSTSSHGGNLPEDNGCALWSVLEVLFEMPVRFGVHFFFPDMTDLEDPESNGSLWKAILALVVSLVFIGMFSEVAIWQAEYIGALAGLSPTTAGATLLAFGAQTPDMATSLALARHNKCSSAVSNAVGSQVLNVSFGTGLPFLLYSILARRDMNLPKHSHGVTVLVILLGIVIATFLLLISPSTGTACTPRIGTTGGVTLLIVFCCCYAIYLAYDLHCLEASGQVPEFCELIWRTIG